MLLNEVPQLQAAAYQLLLEADQPLPTPRIAHRLFGAGRHEHPETQVVVRALLEADPRFLETHDFRWSAREAPHVSIPLKTAHFVVVDLETTGSLIGVDKIIEIGIVVCRGSKIIEEFSTLVRTDRKIPPWVETLTGIHRADLTSAPSFADLIVDLDHFFTDAVFVAHDVLFDLPFLRWEYTTRNLEMPGVIGLCTLRLARYFWPDLPSRSLPDLARHFQIQHTHPHRAGQDATATAGILARVLNRAHRSGMTVIGDLYRAGRKRRSASSALAQRAQAAD